MHRHVHLIPRRHVRGEEATVSRTGKCVGPALLFLAFALALSACPGNRNREVRDPRPENYKSDILAMLHVYLRDPTQIRDAAASEPTPVLVGTTNRYAVCLRFNAKKS